MSDVKEELIEKYLELKLLKETTEEEKANDLDLLELKMKLNTIKQRIHVQERGYDINVEYVNAQMQHLKEDLIECWDSDDKSFECELGSATIRTTRSLKVDNKELLIGILQHFGKLTQCIKSWDLTYLRKLVDADLFEGADVMHYNEKRSVVISGVKNKEGARDGE